MFRVVFGFWAMPTMGLHFNLNLNSAAGCLAG